MWYPTSRFIIANYLMQAISVPKNGSICRWLVMHRNLLLFINVFKKHDKLNAVQPADIAITINFAIFTVIIICKLQFSLNLHSPGSRGNNVILPGLTRSQH
jgi:hypothetical protein